MGTLRARVRFILVAVAICGILCASGQVDAADQETFEKSLEHTRAVMETHHLIAVVFVDGERSFRSDRYPDVERLEMNDKVTYARKTGMEWMRSDDLAESGVRVTLEEAKKLDVLSSYVALPATADAIRATNAFAGTGIVLLKREIRDQRELLYYQVIREKPSPLGNPEYVFTKSTSAIDEKSLLTSFYGLLSPDDNPVRLAVDYFYVEETLAEQKKREEKTAETRGGGAGDPSQAAWTFFELCATGKIREALESAAPILRARLDVPRLQSALGPLGLKGAGPITWKSGKIFTGVAIAEGTCGTKLGKVMRLRTTLVRDGGAWRVYSAGIVTTDGTAPLISLFAPADPAVGGATPALPDEKMVRELVQRDLRLFADIQDSEHFQELYRSSGGRARKMPVETWEMLARLRDHNLTARKALDAPVYFPEARVIGPDGVCVANVHIDISPLQLRIKYNFVLTADGWHQAGKEGQLVPDARELERLSRETLVRFDEAVRRRSFTEFHERVAQKWKAQATPGQMEQAFRAFIEKQVVLGGLVSAPIVIGAGPAEDSAGLVEFSGRCETTPLSTRFTMKYCHEDGEWRLFQIDVSLHAP